MYALQGNALLSREQPTVSPSAHQPPEVSERPTAFSRAVRAPASRPRVLLVAKEAADRVALTVFLTANGFHVTAADNDEEALRCLRQAPLPALVLLDLETAVRECLEVCRQRLLSAALRRVPLVALSGGERLPASLAVSLGIVAHLHWPLCRDALLETLMRFCG